MRTKEDNIRLANLLFPDVKDTPEDVFKKYPKRNTKGMVLRFAPSPTGFIHIGNIYTGFLCTKLAKQSNGISILRIEDTDKEREVENGVTQIVEGLKGFGIEFDEGMLDEDSWKGEYGPYIQSKRLDIYHLFSKYMVSKCNSYPCFLTEEELEGIRGKQEELKVRTGCYGKWAKYRDSSLEEIGSLLKEKKEFVIRLYSTGNIEESFNIVDLVKGGITLRENDMDAVLLKSDGYPTYHFAHPIDDMLMGITHVIRGDEWFSSVSLHIELFEKLGFEKIPYVHISPLMKLDEGKKRKLSKRKDPEFAVSYYLEKGYPKKALLEYLLNIANSNFYNWRIQNPKSDIFDFELKIEKFNKAGALFDMVKLNDTCKEYISTLTANQVYDMALEWANIYDKEVYKLLKENRDYCVSILNIERTGERIRKDIVKFEDIKEQLEIFFDDMLQEPEDISNTVSKEKQEEILRRYLEVFDINDSQEEWFERIKEMASELDFERVGDVAMVLRVAITHRTRTPDLYQVINVLEEKKVRERIQKYIAMMV